MFPATTNLGYPRYYTGKTGTPSQKKQGYASGEHCIWSKVMRPVRNQITNGLSKKTNTNARQKKDKTNEK